MPVLPQNQALIKQFYLPSYASLPQEQQGWVKLDVGPALAGETLLYDDTDSADMRFIKLLSFRIKEWNMTEDNGTAIPVNVEGVKRLLKPDYLYLVEQIVLATQQQPVGELATAEKKS